jgi:hypothetical protein
MINNMLYRNTRPLVILGAVVLVMLLAGCGYGENQMPDNGLSRKDFSVLCLDGVEYYARNVGPRTYMAARIDKDTLMPSRCAR